MAIHILEPNLPKPAKLRFHIQQLVRGVLGLRAHFQDFQELLVEPAG